MAIQLFLYGGDEVMAKTLAYVLVQTASGQALSAVRAVREIGGVTSARAVTGLYDMICQVEADSLEQLAGTVVNRIQAVGGVERTETALVIHTD